ncbi:MAG: hypothetical protein H7210_12345 [Pyrinomonadaceae bacterium]|nr:hypothetical protein [Phycisphaerales bacterium]
MNAESNTSGQAGAKVVLVGHCVPDSYMLRSAVQRAVPDATIVMVNSSEELDEAMQGADLLLVNRALDGYFRAGGGVELIRQLAGERRGAGSPSIMLVSDIASAQQEAEAAGAVPGIGKKALYADQTRERLAAGVRGTVA